jgi:hypothetical protein
VGRHLSEERLLECYLAERDGEGIAPPAAEHLADCRTCHVHYVQLVDFMDATWAAADAETSVVFTEDRLRLQQQEIARRLEQIGHAARVLNFPSGPDGQANAVDAVDVAPEKPDGPLTGIVSRVATRWVAVAAAAGLFIGVAAGVSYDQRSHPRSPMGPTSPMSNVAGGAAGARPSGAPAPGRIEAPVSAADPASNIARVDPGDIVADDTIFMSELEAALIHPRTPELMALDALTPHAPQAREITYRIR